MNKIFQNPYDKSEDNRWVECQQFLDNIPNICDGYNKTVLYVGANCSRAFLHDILWDLGYIVDIIEIHEENIKCIRDNYRFRNLIHGDIADESIYGNYDLIFWYHGPEHVSEEKFSLINSIFEKKAPMIVLGCPHKDLNKYDSDQNPFEKHIWEIDIKDLENYNYNVSKVERINAADNIIAWKKINK